MSYGTGRIERCTDNRPPFRTSAHIDGNRPHYSHTSNGLRLTAPLDIDDTIGQFAALEIVGDAGFSFGVGAWAQNTMGYGFGYIYDNPLGTQVYDHTDPLTGNLWQFERKTPAPTYWRGHEDVNGVRCMRTDSDGGHAFGFDTGIPTPENTIMFMSRLLSATYSDPTPTENLQWKSARWQNAFDLTNDGTTINLFYAKTFDRDQLLTERSLQVESTTAENTYVSRAVKSLHHPVHDGVPTLHQVTVFNGTRDNYDGYIKTGECKNGLNYNEIVGSDSVIGDPSENSNLKIFNSISTNTPRVVFYQDYYDDAGGGDQTILQYATFCQHGSAERIMVGDNANPYLCSDIALDLPIIKRIGSNIVIVPWYKGIFSTIANKHLHYFNDEGVYSGSIQAVV